jgi:hypothetical protein
MPKLGEAVFSCLSIALKEEKSKIAWTEMACKIWLVGWTNVYGRLCFGIHSNRTAQQTVVCLHNESKVLMTHYKCQSMSPCNVWVYQKQMENGRGLQICIQAAATAIIAGAWQ